MPDFAWHGIVQAFDRAHDERSIMVAQEDRKSASQVEEGTLGLAHLFFSVWGVGPRPCTRCFPGGQMRVETIFQGRMDGGRTCTRLGLGLHPASS